MKLTSRRRWYWTVAVAFAGHNAEEGMMAPVMLQLMRSRAPEFLQQFYVAVDVTELRSSLLILSVVGLCLAAAAARSEKSRGWSYAMLLFGTVMSVNGVVHLVFSIAWREYMPGTLTAAFVTLPAAIAMLVTGYREAWITRPAYGTLVPAALVVHGPVLAALIPALIRIVRLVVGRA